MNDCRGATPLRRVFLSGKIEQNTLEKGVEAINNSYYMKLLMSSI